MAHVAVHLDLAFDDDTLEKAFRAEYARSMRSLDVSLAVFVRGLVWPATALKALLRGHYSAASWLCFFVWPTGTLPFWVMTFLSWDVYIRWREVILTTVNLSQYLQASYFYTELFGSNMEPKSLTQTLAALITGSALSWLYLFLVWFASLGILSHFNYNFCYTSQPLQKAYLKTYVSYIKPLWHWVMLNVVGMNLDDSTAEYIPDPMRICIAAQPMMQLALGYLLPCYILVWRRELRARQRFLQARGITAQYGWPGDVEFITFAVLAALCFVSLVCLPTAASKCVDTS